MMIESILIDNPDSWDSVVTCEPREKLKEWGDHVEISLAIEVRYRNSATPGVLNLRACLTLYPSSPVQVAVKHYGSRHASQRRALPTIKSLRHPMGIFSTEWLSAQQVYMNPNGKTRMLLQAGDSVLKARHIHHERRAVDYSVSMTLEDAPIN
jgi:hypothetical protein